MSSKLAAELLGILFESPRYEPQITGRITAWRQTGSSCDADWTE